MKLFTDPKHKQGKMCNSETSHILDRNFTLTKEATTLCV